MRETLDTPCLGQVTKTVMSDAPRVVLSHLVHGEIPERVDVQWRKIPVETEVTCQCQMKEEVQVCDDITEHRRVAAAKQTVIVVGLLKRFLKILNLQGLM